jgi:hypothetical protein
MKNVGLGIVLILNMNIKKNRPNSEEAIKLCIKLNYLSSCRGNEQGGLSYTDAFKYKLTEKEQEIIDNTYDSLFKNKRQAITIGQEPIKIKEYSMEFKKRSKRKSVKRSKKRSKRKSKRVSVKRSKKRSKRKSKRVSAKRSK